MGLLLAGRPRDGAATVVGVCPGFELIEYFLGDLPEANRRARHPDAELASARAARLELDDVRTERLRLEFFDVGAVVYLLRKVIWWVPDFSVERYLPRLRELHGRIEESGPFVAHSSRTLFVAHRR